MKHAGTISLHRLEALLAQLRSRALVEKKRGVYYRGARAFLHFHEDPSGLYADMRPHDEWERYAVNDAAQQRVLLQRVDAVLAVVCRNTS